jgi:hypothetical protein
MIMKLKREIIILAFVAAVMVSGGNANADYTFGMPLNMGPTLNSPAVEEKQFSSSDGLELYFMSMRDGGYGDWDLYVSTRETIQDPWGEPLNMGSRFNTSGFDGAPCLTADNLELYFCSERPGALEEGSYLWISKRATRDDEWGEPVNFGPIYLDDEVQYGNGPCLSSDGLELYFDVWRGPQAGIDLGMISRPSVSDPWGEPVNLGPTVNMNGSSDNYNAALSSDGRMLFFNSNRSGGQGGYDLWLTSRETPDEEWGQPVNLGPRVNTSTTDANPSISADGRTLYFMSPRGGGYGDRDMWQVSIDQVVDLNGDGMVDWDDMWIMADFWDTNEPLCDIAPMPWGDGVVDVNDLIVLVEHFFEGLPDNVIERRISAGSDDAEEALNYGYNNWNNSSDLELVHDYIDNGGPQLVGMTFRDIDIEPGEVIENAYIEFVCDEILNGTLDAYFLIWGHLTPNSEGFVAPFVISNRPQTAAKVPWQPDPWDAGGQTIRTVNIAPIIQELINQEGWVAGNAVEIIIGADPDKPAFNGVRVSESYDGSPWAAPLLHIEVMAADQSP